MYIIHQLFNKKLKKCVFHITLYIHIYKNMSIIAFTQDIELEQIESLVKTREFFQDIIKCINDTIINYNSSYNEQLDIQDEINIKKMSIRDIRQIFANFNKILNKYFTVKPDATILIDLDSQWYSSDKMLIETGDARPFSPPTPNNRIMSKILTINCKLIDFLNDVHILQIKSIKNNIRYMKHELEQKKSTISVNQYNYLKSVVEAKVTQYNTVMDQIKSEFKEIHTQSKPIQSYFLIRADFVEYLSTIPISIFNIFNSSLFFIEDDIEFLDFVIKQKEWLPSELRCEYLKKIMKLMEKQGLEQDVLVKLHTFNPNPVILVDDIITMYWKSKKDPESISYIYMLQMLISRFKQRINIYTIDIQKLIMLTSVELELISKLDKTQLGLEQKIYESMCYTVLDNINHLVNLSPEIFNCYLIYQIPNVLLKLFDETFTNTQVYSMLNSIFTTHMSSRHGIYYLSSMIDEAKMTKLQTLLTEEQAGKLTKWYKVYKHINDNVFDSDIVDPLTSTVLVIPSVFPMSTDDPDNIGICDKHVFGAYLWEKKENPFTRSELTIQAFEEFTTQPRYLDKINEVKAKLREYVKQVDSL